MNQTIILDTCHELGTNKPMLDAMVSILKTQWISMVISFVIVPFIIMMIFKKRIKHPFTYSIIHQEIIMMFLLTIIFSIISYLVTINMSFTFITNLMNLVR